MLVLENIPIIIETESISLDHPLSVLFVLVKSYEQKKTGTCFFVETDLLLLNFRFERKKK